VLVALCALGGARPRLGWAWLGLALGLAPAVAWFVLAARVGTPGYAQTIGIQELLDHFVHGKSHHVPAPQLWGEFLAGVLPAGLFLVPAVAEAVVVEKNARTYGSPLEERLPLLLPLAWLGVSLAVFSISSSKRGVYLVPAYPAVALLLAWYWGRGADTISRPGRIATEVLGTVVAVLGLLAVPAVLALRWVRWREWGVEPLAPWVEAGVLAVVLVAVGAVARVHTRRSPAFAPVVGLGTLLAFGVAHARIVPAIDPVKSAERAARTFTDAMPPGSEWAQVGAPQDGIVYYAKRTVARFELTPEGLGELRAWFVAHRSAPRFVFVKDANEDKLLAEFPGLAFVARARIGESVFELWRLG
jgi:4-amino-4-deoxy-L-arabinose transferase-like glycosyltransferase